MAEESPAAPDPGPPPEGGEGDGEEFARIPPPARRRSPVTSLAVISLGALLLFRLSDDTRFALSARAPRELGEARALRLGAGDSALEDNTFVAVRGIPDRRNALLFEPKGDSYRRAFHRLLGTNTRLLVRAEQTATPRPLDDRFVGRLRRFDRIGYAAQVRDYYAREVTATRLVDLESLKRRLAAPATPLVDRVGDPVAFEPSEEVWLEVDFPDDLKVSLSKKQFAVEEDARHELERLVAPVSTGATLPEGFLFVVRVPIGKRDAYLKQLEEHGFPFAARRERFVTRAGELGPAEGGLSLPVAQGNPSEYDVSGASLVPRPAGARIALPWPRVASVHVQAPIRIPDDAWLLVEGEAPGDFAWVLAIDALLALFIAFNVWLLVRYARERRAPGGSPSPVTR